MKIHITVSDVLKLDYFKKHTLIAGKTAVDNIVTNAVITETDDIGNYLPPGTIVATLASHFTEKEDELLGLIQKLHDAKISALCIKPKRFLNSIPPSVLELCNSLPLPLIVSPPDSTPTEFINNVLRLILNAETAKLQLLGDSSTFIKKCMHFDELNESEKSDILLESKMNGLNLSEFYYIFIYENEPIPENRRDGLFQQLLYDLRSADSSAFGAIFDSYGALFYHCSKSDNSGRLQQTAHTLSKRLLKYNLPLFISRQLRGIPALKKGFFETVSCIELNQLIKINTLRSPIFYQDMVFLMILNELLLNDSLCRTYIQSVLLEPISDETPTRKKEILQMLRIYLKENGKVKKIADITHVHTNTVLYRIQYIESSYGCDLKDYHTQWKFYLALMLYDIKSKKNS